MLCIFMYSSFRCSQNSRRMHTVSYSYETRETKSRARKYSYFWKSYYKTHVVRESAPKPTQSFVEWKRGLIYHIQVEIYTRNKRTRFGKGKPDAVLKRIHAWRLTALRTPGDSLGYVWAARNVVAYHDDDTWTLPLSMIGVRMSWCM